MDITAFFGCVKLVIFIKAKAFDLCKKGYRLKFRKGRNCGCIDYTTPAKITGSTTELNRSDKIEIHFGLEIFDS